MQKELSPEEQVGVFTVENLPVLTKERIYVPAIDYLYKEYEDRKILAPLQSSLRLFPPEMQPVVVQILVTHVTKEKPVFIHALGKSFVKDSSLVCEVAACVDLLWALSMMIDDIVDNDQQRAGKPTSWVVFGRELTEQTVRQGLEIVGGIMEAKKNGVGANLLKEHIERGLASLKAPELSALNSTSRELLDNIDRRASFHCELPMQFMKWFSDTEGKNCLGLGMEALYASNRAGQVLNDLKDLVPSDLYGRQLFSDIKSGIVTVPISIMLQRLSVPEMDNFSSMFGRNDLSETEISYLKHLIVKRLDMGAVLEIVVSTYVLVMDRAKAIVMPQDLMVFDTWIHYKLAQAHQLVGSIK